MKKISRFCSVIDIFKIRTDVVCRSIVIATYGQALAIDKKPNIVPLYLLSSYIISTYGVVEGAERFTVDWHQQEEANNCARQGKKATKATRNSRGAGRQY